MEQRGSRGSRRQANRVHCKETRERRKERERLLREEVESLLLYQLLVEDGPDLFSLHAFDLQAPFSFISKSFCQKLQIVTENIIGLPLATIVDARDADALQTALSLVLNQEDTGEDPLGMTVNVRLKHGALAACEASMSISIGSEGLVVVTRVY